MSIAPTGVAVTDAARRAEIIYAQARSLIDARLWRAALGTGTTGVAATPDGTPPLSLTTLIGLFAASDKVGAAVNLPTGRSGDAAPVAAPIVGPAAARTAAPAAAPNAVVGSAISLGRNAGYATSISRAAERAGLPAAALASIIDAEAAKHRDGSWQTSSHNARSTASGLGQFLAGTWRSEAERAGTWLNATARQNGWIGADGRVLPAARTALLDLREDAEASINATADYAGHSLAKLVAAGVEIGTTASQIAQTAYLGHNLGLGDAIRFLRGGLDESRAQRLLVAQIGATNAGRRVAEAGGAAAAHRSWLLEFMARHVDATRYGVPSTHDA